MEIQIWQPGDKIKGDRFEIVRKLGEGGFGITYLANDRTRKQQVVIKTLNRGQQIGDKFLEVQEKFVQEGFLLRSFDHPNIVKVYEPVQFGQLWGLVMEYIPGRDLEKYTASKGRLSEKEALHYIDLAAQALDFIHRPNYFHRDVKPQNIMLREASGEPVLIDFGLAREFVPEENIYLTNTLGTLAYKPIEQYGVKGVFGPYTDVYPLAITLYHLVVGLYPPDPEITSQFEVIPYSAMGRKHGNGPIEAEIWAKLAATGVSNRTQQAIKRGMSIEPQDRPQTMTEFRELLGLVRQRPQRDLPKAEVVVPEPVPASKPLKQPERRVLATPAPKIVLKKFDFEVAEIEMGGLFGRKPKIVRRSAQGDCFVEDLRGGGQLEMVRIRLGSFQMGSPENEEDRLDWESPQHLVQVPAFYMGRYPVTQRQYKEIMGQNPAHFKGDNLPVENVSWNDAQEFCAKLSQRSGKAYRLPSEAEWEYACRAGTTTPFHFGETIDAQLANYRAQDWKLGDTVYSGKYGKGELGIFRGKTVPVGSLGGANKFGLSDMHGNVWEWCQDEWHDNYRGAPTDGSAWSSKNDNHSQSNVDRLLRGGSWRNSPSHCRSANRNRRSADHRNNNIGFRVVVSQHSSGSELSNGNLVGVFEESSPMPVVQATVPKYQNNPGNLVGAPFSSSATEQFPGRQIDR